MATNPVKKKYIYTIKDSFKEYAKQDRPIEVTWKQYKGIMHGVFGMISRKIIQDNWTFYIPHKMGALSMVSYDQTKEEYNPVDYNMSRKLNKTVMHMNFHSFRRTYKIKWVKSFVKFLNRKFYKYNMPGGTLAKRYDVGKEGVYKLATQANTDQDTKLIK